VVEGKKRREEEGGNGGRGGEVLVAKTIKTRV
jgi:hypothetical protein